MNQWYQHCPNNFRHFKLLMDAEIARLSNHSSNASKLYDQAIKAVQKYGYLRYEALINEFAAKFYLMRKQERIASLYLKEAHYCYTHWGAKAKIQHLETKYPQWLSQSSSSQAKSFITSTSTSSRLSSPERRGSDHLDLTTVLKASQTISGEIVLADLLKKMMINVLENAGAQKGILILKKSQQWMIEAEGKVGETEVKVLQSLPIDKSIVPVSIIHYVTRTKKSLVLDNPSQEERFDKDSYLLQNQPKSLLCHPILHSRRLIGILYLENNLTTGAFTSDRLEILKILSSQAAISIENASLYANLEEKVEERTRELKQTQIQLVQSEKMAGLATMVAGAAHELNNPNNFISAGVANLQSRLEKLKTFLYELLEEDTADEFRQMFESKLSPLFKNLDSISHGSQRIQTIVQGLLTFSRLNKAEQKWVNIVDILQSTLDLVQTNYQDQVDFVCHFQAKPKLDCGPAELGQAFMNIMINACQAIVESKKQESASTEPQDNPSKLTIKTFIQDECLAHPISRYRVWHVARGAKQNV